MIQFSLLPETLGADHPLRDEDRAEKPPLNARSAAPTKAGATSSRDRPEKHFNPDSLERRARALPICTCHGLNSPYWPRIVTSIRQGARITDGRPSAFDAISDARGLHRDHRALAAEPLAVTMPMPSSSSSA